MRLGVLAARLGGRLRTGLSRGSGRGMAPALLSEERHQHHAGHVVRRDGRAQQRASAEDPALGAALGERRLDDLVLGEEAGQPREADDGEVAEAEGDEGDRHVLAQAAVLAHVDLVVHAVHDRAGTEEQPGLEEAVRHQVHDREDVADRAEAGGQHHVADLRHGRPGQRLLDVVLRATDDRTEEERDGTDDGDDQLRVRGGVEDVGGADDQVDARGHHRRGVDEGRDRGRALHRVPEPGLQRYLSRLAAGGEQQHQADGGELALGRLTGCLQHRPEGEAAEPQEHQHDRDRQAHVTDAVDQEGLLRGGGGAGLVLPEADEEVGGEAHALPADVQEQVVVGEDEQQHRREEQVQISEEAAAPLVVLHVPDRVQVDQRADARDQQHERHRQLVEAEGDVRLEALDRDPAEQVARQGPVLGVLAEQVGEEDHTEMCIRDSRTAVRPLRAMAPRPAAQSGSPRFFRPLRASSGWRRRPRPSGGNGTATR